MVLNERGWFSRHQLWTVSNLVNVLVICTGLLKIERLLNVSTHVLYT